MNVAVEPSAHDYKPGAKNETRVKLTDLAGKPVRGSIVVSVYDKSLEYISGGPNVYAIRHAFFWRRSHYTYGSSSLDQTSPNLLKRDETPMADLGIVGDVHKVLPQLIDALKARS